jgi:hypothetical protein
MRSGWWRVIAGLLIIVAGVLLLLVQFEWITLEGTFWGTVFLLGGAAFFLALWLGDRAEWWPLIPGGVMLAWGLSTVLGNLGLAEWLVTLIGMVGSSLPFLYIFTRNRKTNWWALIPGGVLLLVGVATVLGELIGGDWVSTLVLLGIALAFALVFLMDRRNWWALIPAGVLAMVAIGVSPLAVEFLFAVALILFGAYLILRMVLRRS